MALKNNIPVVVVSNTGRAADLIAYSVSMVVPAPGGKDYILRKKHKQQILTKVYSAMPELDKRNCKRCANVIYNCCEKAKLITVFDINSNEALDKYILYALLNGGSNNTESTRMDQLYLSLLWNRPDIAETDIYPSYTEWPLAGLEEIMTIALQEQKLQFVQLLITNGLVMEDYLTICRLRQLYNDSCTANTHIGRMLQMCSKSEYHYLSDVHFLLQGMLRRHRDPLYIVDTEENLQFNLALNSYTFKDPYQELLLWSIFTRKPELAVFFWERCNSPVVSAVIASGLYGSLRDSLGVKNTALRDHYLEYKLKFEKFAVELIDECHKNDENNAIGIVERRHTKWGELDCIQLALSAGDMQFISSPCCQASINLNWRRGMIRAPVINVVFANILPFLILTPWLSFQKLGDSGGSLTCVQKIFVFYQSPISKFYNHSLAYVAFLVLHACVILFDFRPEMSYSEMVLILWTFTYIAEEVNELCNEEGRYFTVKIHDWWSDAWNQFDVVSYLMFIAALLLRIQPETFKFGRILFALTTTIFYIRLFRIYHASYKLGPKLVIFYRMISEVLVFMALLIIFILGYGIASQALLHPWRTFHNTSISTILTEVLLTPYWQMYGELLLDKIEGSDYEHCPVSTNWGVEVCENPMEYTWVANVMLVFYLIIGNIMLLNLLIAIFTYVFDEVQENSMEIWKLGMCRLLKEYDMKPILIPPFMLIEHIFRLLMSLLKCYKTAEDNLDECMTEALRVTSIFEKETMTSHLVSRQAKKEASVENRVARIENRINKVVKFLEEEEDLKEFQEDIENIDLDNEDNHESSSKPNQSVSQNKSQSSVQKIKYLGKEPKKKKKDSINTRAATNGPYNTVFAAQLIKDIASSSSDSNSDADLPSDKVDYPDNEVPETNKLQMRKKSMAPKRKVSIAITGSTNTQSSSIFLETLSKHQNQILALRKKFEKLEEMQMTANSKIISMLNHICDRSPAADHNKQISNECQHYSKELDNESDSVAKQSLSTHYSDDLESDIENLANLFKEL